ncbi:MAG: ABC transporter substrate-binding protein [Archangium sp.]|nr:ABC transporter substrate-binding protein [Archangium sp.]
MIAPLVLALALAAGPGPMSVVKTADTEVQKVLQAPDASTSKLAARADEFVDFAELAKRAMGTEWAKLNKKQQDDFGQTMKGLLRASYAQKAVNDGRGGSGAKVEYGDEKVEGNEAVVSTKLLVKQDVYPVVYKLYRADAKGPWRIYDVVTDEVSLVSTYSDQFRKVMGTKGFDGLLKSLKDKQESLEKQNAEKTAAVPEKK